MKFETAPFCHGDEENGHHACMNGHLTTADQSEIRKANLVSVVLKKEVNVIQSIFTHILASMVGAVIGVFSLCIVQGGKMGDKSFDDT